VRLGVGFRRRAYGRGWGLQEMPINAGLDSGRVTVLTFVSAIPHATSFARALLSMSVEGGILHVEDMQGRLLGRQAVRPGR
jgi:hypothetical protein